MTADTLDLIRSYGADVADVPDVADVAAFGSTPAHELPASMRELMRQATVRTSVVSDEVLSRIAAAADERQRALNRSHRTYMAAVRHVAEVFEPPITLAERAALMRRVAASAGGAGTIGDAARSRAASGRDILIVWALSNGLGEPAAASPDEYLASIAQAAEVGVEPPAA